jgi:hypothetical protein
MTAALMPPRLRTGGSGATGDSRPSGPALEAGGPPVSSVRKPRINPDPVITAQGATPTALRETVREFAPSKSAKMGNLGFKEPWKILAFGKCRRKRLSCQCFQSLEFPDTLTALRGRVFKCQTDSHSHAKPWTWHPTGTSRPFSALNGPDSKAQGEGSAQPWVNCRPTCTSPERAEQPLRGHCTRVGKGQRCNLFRPVGATVDWGSPTQACAALRPGLQNFAPLGLRADTVGRRSSSLACPTLQAKASLVSKPCQAGPPQWR